MTTDEILAYQATLRAIGSAHAEKVRHRGGSPAEMADAYVSVMEWCGWPEPRTSQDDGKYTKARGR